MAKREELNTILEGFIPNVYFQPPSNIKMKYPCIVYSKTSKDKRFGNDKIYFDKQIYRVTLIETDPDSDMAELIESYFDHCVITTYYTMDNLNHTVLTLYY